MSKIIGYYVTAKSTAKPELQFLNFDEMSGGYPYWSDYPGRRFETEAKAKKALSDNVSAQGKDEQFPGPSLHRAAGLNNAVKHATVRFNVVPVILGEAILTETMDAEIRSPSRAELRQQALAKLTREEREAILSNE